MRYDKCTRATNPKLISIESRGVDITPRPKAIISDDELPTRSMFPPVDYEQKGFDRVETAAKITLIFVGGLLILAAVLLILLLLFPVQSAQIQSGDWNTGQHIQFRNELAQSIGEK